MQSYSFILGKFAPNISLESLCANMYPYNTQWKIFIGNSPIEIYRASIENKVCRPLQSTIVISYSFTHSKWIPGQILSGLD